MGVTNPKRISDFLVQLARRGRAVKDGGAGNDSHSPTPVRMLLFSQMAKAKRNGGWFRLTRLERGLFSLALRINAKFESLPLVRALVSVLTKLQQVSHPFYEHFVRGLKMAAAFADAAIAWGNRLAAAWKNDSAYAIFLGRFVPRTKLP